MKIEVSKHDIRETENVGLKEIPLAFIDTNDSEYDVDVKLNPEFSKDKKSQVKPYDVFADDSPFFFTNDGKLLKDTKLKRKNDKYIYEPSSIKEYSPATFACSILIKRNMQYRNNVLYSLRVGVAEEGIGLDFSNKLIAIFGDAYKRGICPANILINDGNMIPQSLIANTIEANDFMIINSADGITTTKDKNVGKIDIDSMLDLHTNVWLSVDDFAGVLKVADTDEHAVPQRLSETQLFANKDYAIDEKKTYTFDADGEHSNFPRSKYRYSLLHPSILIMERADKGFVIVTPSVLFKDLAKNAALIYEILMNIYLRSYYESPQVTSWITDAPVDYIAGQENKLNAKHKTINIDSMLNDSKAGDDYTIVKINSTNPNVLFAGMTGAKDLLFYKIGSHTDVEKTDAEISYFTTKSSIVNYKPEDIYESEKKAEMESVVVNNDIVVTVHPFHSSKHKINFEKDCTFRLASKQQEYCICTKESSPDIQNVIRLVDKQAYEQDQNAYGILIASIKVFTKPATTTYDIRIEGGGLPEKYPDNYNMVDIGHINGRPYRVGSTVIIRLPKALKKHEEKIMKALNQHIAAGDYPVLIFE